MKILIIGAGPSGLAAAKAAIERGLKPEVYEKADTLGGVWRKNGLAWPQMRVNISRFTGVFTDFPWDDSKPAFPTTEETCEYLTEYAKHFNLDGYIKFGRCVTHVSQQDDGWSIRYLENEIEHNEYYDAVIVASGKYGKPIIPNIQGLNDFTGEKLHSCDYRGQEFKGKTVLVVGGSTSGTSIAETVAETSDQVIHAFRLPRWIMPRNVPTGVQFQGLTLPHDLIKTRERQRKFSLQDHYNYYTNLCQEQIKIPAWVMKSSDRFGVVIADTYLQKVDEDKILPVKDQITSFEESHVVFKSGKKVKIDCVIFCTGYETDLSYFDKDLVQKFNLSLPMYSLYKHTIHPDFPTLAFIALTYREFGAVFPCAELQAALACEYFSGKLCLPPAEELKSTITSGQPIVDGLQLLDSLADSLEMMPHLSTNSSHAPDIYHLLWNGAAIPAQYRLRSGEESARLARVTLEKTEKYRQYCLSESTADNVDVKINYQTTGIFGNSSVNRLDELSYPGSKEDTDIFSIPSNSNKKKLFS